jgi:hypothetical protein
MASYHCSVKAGASAGAAAHDAYIEREGKYKKDRDDLEAVEGGNLPTWASCSADFWKASDEHERANAKGYQEYEVALPRELSPQQRLELVREFVRGELGERHTYTFAIHTPRAALDGGEQPHAHIMFSDRHLDGIERPATQHFKRYNAKNPEKGGCRKGEGMMTGEQRSAQLHGIRERWAELQNKHLAMNGHGVRVDHRSLADQGIEREPEQHLGPKQIQTQSPAVDRVLQARSDRTLAAMLGKAIAAAQRRIARVHALALAYLDRAARRTTAEVPVGGPAAVAKPVAGADQVNELAGFLELLRAERKHVIEQGLQLETKMRPVPEQKRAQAANLKTRIEALKPPGLMASKATRQQFDQDLANLRRQGQAALDAEHAAKVAMAEARKMQEDPQPFVLAKIRNERPGLIERMQPLTREPDLVKRAELANEEASRTKSRQQPRSQPVQARQTDDRERG